MITIQTARLQVVPLVLVASLLITGLTQQLGAIEPTAVVPVKVAHHASATYAITEARAELYAFADGRQEIRVVYDVRNSGLAQNHRHAWRVEMLDASSAIVTSLSGVTFGDLAVQASATFAQSLAGPAIDGFDPQRHTLRLTALGAVSSANTESCQNVRSLAQCEAEAQSASVQQACELQCLVSATTGANLPGVRV